MTQDAKYTHSDPFQAHFKSEDDDLKNVLFQTIDYVWTK